MGTISAVARGLRSLTPAEIADARAGKGDIVELLQSKGIALAAAPRPYHDQCRAAAEHDDAIRAG